MIKFLRGIIGFSLRNKYLILFLAALLVMGLIFAGMVFVHVPQPVTTIQPASPVVTPYTPPVQQIYQPPVQTVIPVSPPVVVTPVYPERREERDAHRWVPRR